MSQRASENQTPSPTTSLAQHLARHLAGPILDAFERDEVTDIHCNVDGRVRFHTHRGVEVTDLTLTPESVRSVLHLLADDQGDSLSIGTAFFAGRFPGDPPFRRARIHAVLPPVIAVPCFAIRVHAPEIYNLEDFASKGQQEVLTGHVLFQNLNVLIIGGTSTGKTSLLNSFLKIVAAEFPHDRLLCLEDVPEITVSLEDHLPLHTEGNGYTLQDLVANALRLNPTRLVIGEVRGGEALDLIDAWSTGHRGGFATLHADDVNGALLRLERLARRHPRAGNASLRPDIAAALDVVIELRRVGRTPRIAAIHRLAGLSESGQYITELITFSGEPSMPKPSHSSLHPAIVIGLCLLFLYAPSVLAGTAASLANFTAPIQTVIDWVTGDIGRLLSIVVLGFFGMYLWKKRAEDKGERGLMFLLGTAVLLGATNIVDGLGFVGALY